MSRDPSNLNYPLILGLAVCMTLEKSSSVGMKTWQLGRSVTSGTLYFSSIIWNIGQLHAQMQNSAFERRERGRRELVDTELDFSPDHLAEEACAILVATVPALRICFV